MFLQARNNCKGKESIKERKNHPPVPNGIQTCSSTETRPKKTVCQSKVVVCNMCTSIMLFNAQTGVDKKRPMRQHMAHHNKMSGSDRLSRARAHTVRWGGVR